MVQSMALEVIEAVREYYSNDKEMLRDCLVYLNNGNLRYVKNLAHDELVNNNLCEFCGEPLEICHYKEWHSEVGCYEPMTFAYCRNCDID